MATFLPFIPKRANAPSRSGTANGLSMFFTANTDNC